MGDANIEYYIWQVICEKPRDHDVLHFETDRLFFYWLPLQFSGLSEPGRPVVDKRPQIYNVSDALRSSTCRLWCLLHTSQAAAT
mmetsp:Transcript_39366/g.62391  ORF Transcript_39366/g.62391 Transcript_39366/m.62391 type:complete len:84 (+) Transcript_39366:739-990(+)